MKLHDVPVWGWGWVDQAGPTEPPSPFDLDATVIEAGEPFKIAAGYLEAAGHPLSGMWIELAQRHTPPD